MWHYINTPGVEVVQASTLHWLCAELPAVTELFFITAVLKCTAFLIFFCGFGYHNNVV